MANNFTTIKGDSLLHKSIYEGRVISIVDDLSGIIRIKIDELDSNTKDEDLPVCVPFYPHTFIKISPKVGERVTVIFRNNFETSQSYNKDIRYWGSVIHSSPLYNSFQDFYNSTNNYSDGYFKSSVDIKSVPSSFGVYPNSDEVGIMGRNNSQVRLGLENLLLGAGLHAKDLPLSFNKQNPSYVKIDASAAISSVIISSDKLALISHKNNEFNTKNQPDLISEEEKNKIYEQGHPIPYGDKLVVLLDLMRQILINHVHPYDAMKPVQDNLIEKLANFDFTSILNKNVVTG